MCWVGLLIITSGTTLSGTKKPMPITGNPGVDYYTLLNHPGQPDLNTNLNRYMEWRDLSTGLVLGGFALAGLTTSLVMNGYLDKKQNEGVIKYLYITSASSVFLGVVIDWVTTVRIRDWDLVRLDKHRYMAILN